MGAADTEEALPNRAVSRSILLPLLALGGIILYGTTRAARPPAHLLPRGDGPAPIEMMESTPPPRRAAPPSRTGPPPAPGLRSEEAPEVEEIVPGDSTAAPTGELSSGGTVSISSVPFTRRSTSYDEDGDPIVRTADDEQ